MWKLLANAASAQALRHSIQAQVTAALRDTVLGGMVDLVDLTMVMMALVTYIPMASPTTTLRLVRLRSHPLVDMLILHADQAPCLICIKLRAVLA